jgi:hypothetical protein
MDAECKILDSMLKNFGDGHVIDPSSLSFSGGTTSLDASAGSGNAIHTLQRSGSIISSTSKFVDAPPPPKEKLEGLDVVPPRRRSVSFVLDPDGGAASGPIATLKQNLEERKRKMQQGLQQFLAVHAPHEFPSEPSIRVTKKLPQANKNAPVFKLMDAVDEIRDLELEATRMTSNGTFSDAELDAVSRHEKDAMQRRLQAAKSIQKALRVSLVDDPDVASPSEIEDATEALGEYLVECMSRGDMEDSNAEFCESIFLAQRAGRLVPECDLVALSETRGLIASACADGSNRFLELLLEQYCAADGDAPRPQSLDMEEVTAAAIYNQLHRIPVTFTLLKYTLRGDQFPGLHEAFCATLPTMKSEWNDFLHVICSTKKLNPREATDDRLSLINLIVSAREFKGVVAAEDEGGDQQTRFSRAAKEGDLGVLYVLASALPPTDVWTLCLRSQSDGTTALIQAVLGGHDGSLAFVADLMRCAHDNGDAEMRSAVRKCLAQRCQEGSALEIAEALGRTSMCTRIKELRDNVEETPDDF